LLALLRTSAVATLGGWGVAVAMVVVGERWLAPTPTLDPCAPIVGGQRPPPPMSQPTPEPVPDDARIAGGALDPGLPSQTAHRLVVADSAGVNLRAEPSTASKIIAVVPKGTLLEGPPSDGAARALSPDWRQVVWNGQAGWVAASLLEAASPP